MASPLTTLASVKLFLGITNSSSDAVLTALIDQCCGAIELYCERTLGSAQHAEWMDGNGGQRLVLRDWPVTAFATVQIDGLAVSPAADSVSAGYRFFDAGELVLNQGARFTRGVMNVFLDYTAGYASNAIPGPLTLVANRLVGGVWKSKDWLGISSKSLAGETVAFFKDEIEKPANKSILDEFRRVTP